jgi:membrane associated rhomboid family serine protease
MLPLRDDNRADNVVPIVNCLLIAANVIAFFATVNYGQSFFNEHCVVASRFVRHCDLTQIGTIFTCMFLHAGLAHLLGNMWFLWVFGDNVEDRLGSFTYLIFYLLCGFVGGVVQVIAQPFLNIPALGASGAIAGVLGAYLYLFPKAPIRTWVLWFWAPRFPAFFFIGEWFFFQWILGLTTLGQNDGIAYFDHIGGFLTGFVLAMLLARHLEPAHNYLDLR